ncbi:MAG: hypothetical protein OXM01_07915 [Gemmatimonadota bacterium]|nr:hypothetical protein [Gemmatimonadota bacterium]MDE2812932.1 hypothetical protein [Gemmatimonadota bacterium]
MALDQLHTELQALIVAIDNGEGESIATHLRQLDELGQELGSEAPPMLRHYLEKRSYTKALDFLEGRDEAAAPNC